MPMPPRVATPATPSKPPTCRPAAPTAQPSSAPSTRPRNVGWLEERLQLGALQDKYGRKAFPVHATFFLGEIAATSFLILVVTGIYLGLIYTPSNTEITVAGQK